MLTSDRSTIFIFYELFLMFCPNFIPVIIIIIIVLLWCYTEGLLGVYNGSIGAVQYAHWWKHKVGPKNCGLCATCFFEVWGRVPPYIYQPLLLFHFLESTSPILQAPHYKHHTTSTILGVCTHSKPQKYTLRWTRSILSSAWLFRVHPIQL